MTVTINGTTGIAGTNGSAGTPAVQGEDTNTGVFFPAADTVAVATGGAERVRVDSSGNVGIGVAPPSTRLHVSSSTQAYPLRVQVTAGSTAGIEFEDPTTGSSRPNIASRGTALAFETNSAERVRIDASGNLLVGTTANGGGVERVVASVTGGTKNGFSALATTTATATAFVCRNNSSNSVGTITFGTSSTAYNTSSDYRLKENVQPMQDALGKIAQLNPVTYTWKVDGSAGQGFIAHELQAVVPDCVTGEKDAVDAEGNPQYQGVDTSFLVATLVAALQEAHGLIAALEQRVAVLEAA